METSDFSIQESEEYSALRTILNGTAAEIGDKFFTSLVENLARALKTHGALVTEYFEEERRLKAIAFWVNGKWLNDFEYAIEGTPCATVIDNRNMVHIRDRVLDLYPRDDDLRDLGAVSYLGLPIQDVDSKILGHIGVIDTRPMPEDPQKLAVFRIFAARAASELQRLRTSRELKDREQKLARLVDRAMDAILELDRHQKVTQMNPAALRMFHCTREGGIGQNFSQFLSEESKNKLANLIRQLELRPQSDRYLWIPGGLGVIGADGRDFSTEATMSGSDNGRELHYTLVIRNVNERLDAERKIESLTSQTEYLKEEIRSLKNFDEIVGRSDVMLNVLRDIEQVAGTDATVLIHGETGTGKELIARAIHAAGRRREKPLIKVNCAAIPSTLIESEFFGHEQGAFTGATRKREGRFALADGGTIFLDEVGEIPIDVQSKLLRVLQEGEFEPVGSSHSHKVDVRIIAATNLDLRSASHDGRFREDLYYRLNVFPLRLPPLRERIEDIPLLAETFLKKQAQKMKRNFDPLTSDSIRRLQAYDWPGNIRELQNVIELAAITSRDSRLNFDRALPVSNGVNHSVPSVEGRILTARELQEIERQNLIAALEAADWRVAGPKGAASMLGMNSSTMNSRMKALKITRPS
jgi:PAS domain S-box-containing protein